MYHRTINAAQLPAARANAAWEELMYRLAARRNSEPLLMPTYSATCEPGLSLSQIVQPYGTGRRAVFPEGLPHLEVK